jgi:uncharacterized membrane protein
MAEEGYTQEKESLESLAVPKRKMKARVSHISFTIVAYNLFRTQKHHLNSFFIIIIIIIIIFFFFFFFLFFLPE